MKNISCTRRLYGANLKLKLTLVFVIVSLLKAYPQPQPPKLTLHYKQIKITQLFNKIETKTGKGFVYNAKAIDLNRRVSINVTDKSLATVLTQIFKKTGITFEITDNQIVLYKRKSTKNAAQQTQVKNIQQEFVVHGTVTDENGVPISNVTVSVNNGEFTTVTDEQGSYTIKAKPGDKIKFSLLGFEIQVYTVDDKDTTLNIVLKESVLMLNAVSIGYGEKDRSDITGAVSTIDADDIDELSVGTVGLGRALGGLAKGLRISQNTGRPGEPVRINVRGYTSPLSGSLNQPLFVIDGVPFNMDATSGNPLLTINTASIVSVSVLKDAAATSIYGSRGANGVIIIKTKRGKKGEKPQINFSTSLSMASPINTLNPLNASQYKAFQDMLIQNTVQAINKGRVPSFYGFQLGNIGKVAFDPVTGLYTYNGLKESFFGNANTDWNDVVYRDQAVSKQINFGINGGAERTNYAMSLSALNQEGLNVRNTMDKYNLHLALDSKISKVITTGGVLSLGYSKINSGNISWLGSPVSNSIYMARPDLPVRDASGKLLSQPSYEYGFLTHNPNPLEALQLTNIEKLYNFIGNVYMEVEPIKNLKLKGEMNTALFYNDGYQFIPKITMIDFGVPNESQLFKSDNLSTNITTNLTANYSFDISANSFDILVGYSWNRINTKNHSYTFMGFPDDEVLTDVNSAEKLLGYSSNELESGINSLFSRLSYRYKNLYNVTLNFRTDASSKFGPGNKRGYFPSAAVSWTISNTKFLKTSKAIDNLKLRVSYGKVGSANVNDFAYLQFFNTSSSTKYGGNTAITSSNTLPNRNIQWETTLGLNVGLDFAFFDSRLRGSIDVYDRKTTGALAPTPVPLELGPDVYYSNLMDVSNKGMEIQIGGDLIKNKDFTWSVNTNWAYNRNILKDLHGANIDQYSLDYYIEGKPLGTIKGYKVVKILQSQAEVDELNAKSPTGIYSSASLGVGDYLFKDVNGDGEITEEDRTVIGSMEPDFFGGFNTTFRYKNISLSAFFQYSVGAEAIWSSISVEGYNSLGANKLSEYALNTWTLQNTDAKYARAIYSDPSLNTRLSDKFLFKTSYLRLKSLRIMYNFNRKLLKHTFLSKASIFVSGSNLLTWTKWPGTDPELSTIGGGITSMTQNDDPYPLAKSFSVGIQVQF